VQFADNPAAQGMALVPLSMSLNTQLDAAVTVSALHAE
jgi:hypothetical protein